MPKKYLFIIIIIIIAIAVAAFFLSRPKKTSYDFVVVEKQDVIQEVNVTGKVKPVESIDLTFEKGGKVNKIAVSMGEQVHENQLLVDLDSADIKAQLTQGQAQVENARAQLEQFKAAMEVQKVKLAELKAGTRVEEIAVSQSQVDSAQKTLDDAQNNLNNVQNKTQTDIDNLYDDVKNVLNDAYTKADDAVNRQIGELFTNPLSDNPRLNFSVADSQTKNDTEWKRTLATEALKDIKKTIDGLTTDQNILDKALLQTEQNLGIIKDFLVRVNDALNSSQGLSQSTLNSYQGYVNTGRTNVNTAITNINNQKQLISGQKANNQQNISTAQANINSAQNALEIARRGLLLKSAGATLEQVQGQESLIKQAQSNIVSQEAQIKQTQANVENIQAQLAKTRLYSPINGIITKQEAKNGEIVTPNKIIISVMSEAGFQVEANIPEADIGKIKLGDLARITLDAYGNELFFEAKITAIEPAETIIEGVPTYRTTLQFKEGSEKIKSGMTANVTITTNEKENVLAIPYRAIADKNGDKIVKLLVEGKDTEERKIKTGLRGSNGLIEVTEGINEGEKIITLKKK